MKQPVNEILTISEEELIKKGKKISDSNKKELVNILSDEYNWIYQKLVVDNMLSERITIWAMNISQLSSDSDDIISVYAFFQKYAKHIMNLIKDINIDNIDITKENRKNNFLNECNSKIFNKSVIKYLEYAMYDFYKTNPSMIKFKQPFIEIANAAGIIYLLNKYWINKQLLKKTDEERKQRWMSRMKKWWIAFPINEKTNPEETAKEIIKQKKIRKDLQNPN